MKPQSIPRVADYQSVIRNQNKKLRSEELRNRICHLLLVCNVICIYLHTMKKAALPVFTAIMSILFLIGTTGITVIVRSCNCCGPSVETALFEQVTPLESSCCGNMDSEPFIPGTESLDSKCCTYVTQNLKLYNYITSAKITFNVSCDLDSPVYFITAYEAPSVYLKPISYHNKHGGRDMVISYCQYLI